MKMKKHTFLLSGRIDPLVIELPDRTYFTVEHYSNGEEKGDWYNFYKSKKDAEKGTGFIAAFRIREIVAWVITDIE